MTMIVALNEGMNSSVVLLVDGQIRFAIQEERLNKIKEYIGFPHEALRFMMSHCGIKPSDVDLVVLSNLVSPVSSKEAFRSAYAAAADRTLEEVVANAPGVDASIENHSALIARLLREERPEGSSTDAVESVGSDNYITGLVGNSEVHAALGQHGLNTVPVRRYHHQLLHAASAYFGRRKNADEPHLVLTLDGGGDDAVSHVYKVEQGRFELLARTGAGHSVGNLYSHATHFMGMRPHEHEYKLMGLAPYADPDYYAPVVERLSSYLGVDPDSPMTFKRRIPETTAAIEPRFERDFRRVRFDSLAGGMQTFCEALLVEWVGNCVRETGIRNVVAAGGVFMNIKANKLISELPGIDYFDVFPSCGDETLPFGGAWKAWAEMSPDAGRDIRLEHFYWGPQGGFDLEEARQRYAGRLTFSTLDNPNETIADLIAKGHVVARCSGAMEFGARALGNRSILCDPRDFESVRRINKMIKMRDFWMPFAPAIAIESIKRLAVLPANVPDDISPFMMHTFDTTPEGELIAAGRHPYDGTARAQVVSSVSNPDFYDIIKRVGTKTGVEAVLNTSFNLHGFPIVLGACDAADVLLRSGLNQLVVDNVLIEKPTGDSPN